MTGRNTQDDEREALSGHLLNLYDHGTSPNALREADSILAFLASRRYPKQEQDEIEALMAVVKRAFDNSWDDGAEHDSAPADITAAVLAAGYRKHPEPEITGAQALALSEFATWLREKVTYNDWHGELVADGMRDWIADKADERAAALRVPVGEGEQ